MIPCARSHCKHQYLSKFTVLSISAAGGTGCGYPIRNRIPCRELLSAKEILWSSQILCIPFIPRPSWVKSLSTLNIKMNTITLKCFLEPTLPPDSPIPQGEKGKLGHSLFSFFSWSYWWNPQWKGVKVLQVVGMKNTLYTATFISVQLFFMRQMIPAAWLAGWECKVKCLGEVLFKAEHSCFAQMGGKKWGKIKQKSKEKEFQSMGRLSPIKTGASPTL